MPNKANHPTTPVPLTSAESAPAGRQALARRRNTSKTSAISKVRLSGLQLVPTPRKSRGKKAKLRDYAKADFKPWPTGRGGELVPDNEKWRRCGVVCRMAHAVMLKPRDDLIAMHGNADHENVDALMAGFLEAAEDLKLMVQMLQSAYSRVLASAAAAHKQGVKFKFAGDRKAVA